MKQFKIVVEKHPDTYVAYPLGLKGVLVGQGDSYESALEDVKSAIKFHIETFGLDEIASDPPILEAFIAEALEQLGFRLVREGNHIAMLRENPDGTGTPLTIPIIQS